MQKKINAELKQTTGKSLGENIIADAFDCILFQTDYRNEAIQGFETLVRNRDLSRNYLLIVSYTRLEKRRKKVMSFVFENVSK